MEKKKIEVLKKFSEILTAAKVDVNFQEVIIFLLSQKNIVKENFPSWRHNFEKLLKDDQNFKKTLEDFNEKLKRDENAKPILILNEKDESIINPDFYNNIFAPFRNQISNFEPEVYKEIKSGEYFSSQISVDNNLVTSTRTTPSGLAANIEDRILNFIDDTSVKASTNFPIGGIYLSPKLWRNTGIGALVLGAVGIATLGLSSYKPFSEGGNDVKTVNYNSQVSEKNFHSLPTIDNVLKESLIKEKKPITIQPKESPNTILENKKSLVNNNSNDDVEDKKVRDADEKVFKAMEKEKSNNKFEKSIPENSSEFAKKTDEKLIESPNTTLENRIKKFKELASLESGLIISDAQGVNYTVKLEDGAVNFYDSKGDLTCAGKFEKNSLVYSKNLGNGKKTFCSSVRDVTGKTILETDLSEYNGEVIIIKDLPENLKNILNKYLSQEDICTGGDSDKQKNLDSLVEKARKEGEGWFVKDLTRDLALQPSCSETGIKFKLQKDSVYSVPSNLTVTVSDTKYGLGKIVKAYLKFVKDEKTLEELRKIVDSYSIFKDDANKGLISNIPRDFKNALFPIDSTAALDFLTEQIVILNEKGEPSKRKYPYERGETIFPKEIKKNLDYILSK